MKKICLILCLWPFFIFGQIVIDSAATTKNMALVARDAINIGQVVIKGLVDKSDTANDYDKISVKIFRTANVVPQSSSLDVLSPINTVEFELVYSGNIANFNHPIPITAELYNYSFEIDFIRISPFSENKYFILNVVAGDVYVIQGQSNAVAVSKDGFNSNFNQNPFIRTFGSCVTNDAIINDANQNKWVQAKTGQNNFEPGFIGEWGLKLGNNIISNHGIPVAIFNGARGNLEISYFLKNAPPVVISNTFNNYEYLHHRLNATNLKDKVKAVIWSQGENNASLTSGNYMTNYINQFKALKASWLGDYPNIEKFYILQTKSGCNATIGANQGAYVKEAQRQLSDDLDVHIMQTISSTYVFPDGSVNCHFTYTNGYEKFASRIYKLLDRDFYWGTYTADIEPPKPSTEQPYLIDETTLVVNTDAISLNLNNALASDYVLGNANGAVVNSLNVSGNQIIFMLSKYPGSAAKLTFKGLGAGENRTNFITNSENLELVCFADLSIDAFHFTIWNGFDWTYATPPDNTKYVIFNGNYNHSSAADFSARTLTVRPGFTVNFNNTTTTAVTVQDKLDIQGSLTLGDQKSLLVTNVNTDAIVLGAGGVFKKIEKSDPKTNQYSVTYWASPTEASNLQTTFPGVAANRIFELDPSYSNPLYTGQYIKYKHWKTASGSMVKGKGYSVDGPTNGTYPNFVQTIEFSGKPNNGTITIPIKIDGSDGGAHTGYDANLIGNPYPSAIDADLFINKNIGKFPGAIYFWSQQTLYTGGEYIETDYRTYNLAGPSSNGVTDTIGSGQGFMIIASQNGTVEFNNSMRKKDLNNQFFKSELLKGKPVKDQKDRVWLRLKNEENLVKDILIGFFKEATDGEDFGYDALSLSDTQLKFYSLLDEKKYVIQSFGAFDDKKSVAIGIETFSSGKFSIAINQTEGTLKERKIYLQDKVTGKIHDLTKGSYDFEVLSAGDLSERFTIHFKKTVKEHVISIKDHGIHIVNTPNGFNIESKEVMLEIRVYDLFGRMVYKATPNRNSFRIDLPKIKKGTIVLFNITLENGDHVHKKVIRSW